MPITKIVASSEEPLARGQPFPVPLTSGILPDYLTLSDKDRSTQFNQETQVQSLLQKQVATLTKQQNVASEDAAWAKTGRNAVNPEQGSLVSSLTTSPSTNSVVASTASNNPNSIVLAPGNVSSSNVANTGVESKSTLNRVYDSDIHLSAVKKDRSQNSKDTYTQALVSSQTRVTALNQGKTRVINKTMQVKLASPGTYMFSRQYAGPINVLKIEATAYLENLLDQGKIKKILGPGSSGTDVKYSGNTVTEFQYVYWYTE